MGEGETARTSPVVVRPGRGRRWCVMVIGLTALAAAVLGVVRNVGSYPPGAIIYAVAAVLVVIVCALGVTAKATISREGITSRMLVKRVMPAASISGLDVVRRGPGFAAKIVIGVARVDGRRVLLPQTAVTDRPANRALYDTYVAEWRTIVGAGSAASLPSRAPSRAREVRTESGPPTLP